MPSSEILTGLRPKINTGRQVNLGNLLKVFDVIVNLL